MKIKRNSQISKFQSEISNFFPFSEMIRDYTGGRFAELPWRVSYTIGEELGIGLGIWLGSIFDGPDRGAPGWPMAGGIVVIAWFGSWCGIPNILGGCDCVEPGIRGGWVP